MTPAPKLLASVRLKLRVALASLAVLVTGSLIAPPTTQTTHSPPEERPAPLLDQQSQARASARPFEAVQQVRARTRCGGLSPLITTRALGATVANASVHGDRLLCALGRADLPLYAAFFVLGGAELVPSAVLGLGVVLAAIVILEVLGAVLTRRALILTGEARTMPAPLMERP